MMMELFAEELLQKMRHEARRSGSPKDEREEIQGIDIAVTTKPYFVDKANAIAEEAGYTDSSTTQIRECLPTLLVITVIISIRHFGIYMTFQACL